MNDNNKKLIDTLRGIQNCKYDFVYLEKDVLGRWMRLGTIDQDIHDMCAEVYRSQYDSLT